jgi:hypothetical protein
MSKEIYFVASMEKCVKIEKKYLVNRSHLLEKIIENTNMVHLEDFNPDVVRDFVYFLCNGRVPMAIFTNCISLALLGDMFGLLPLVQGARHHLCSLVTEKNVLDCILLLQSYEIMKDILEYCFKYISMKQIVIISGQLCYGNCCFHGGLFECTFENHNATCCWEKVLRGGVSLDSMWKLPQDLKRRIKSIIYANTERYLFRDSILAAKKSDM